MLPVMVWLQMGWDAARLPLVNAAVLLGIAFLMISHVPTFSIKRFTVPHRYVLPVLLLVGLCFASFVSAPWATLIVIGAIYLTSLPFGVVMHRRSVIRHPSPAAKVETFPTGSDRSGRPPHAGPAPVPSEDRAQRRM
jgi:CDP-diacylglycerol--serine O-phosphatidyltransferase